MLECSIYDTGSLIGPDVAAISRWEGGGKDRGTVQCTPEGIGSRGVNGGFRVYSNQWRNVEYRRGETGKPPAARRNVEPNEHKKGP